jgi:hypothetical protein
LNGERPSETISCEAGEVSRAAAYAFSEVTLRLRSRDSGNASRSIEVAWNAVLAGDVDDIVEHVQQELDATR